jgi:hypothetical protein
MAKRFVDTDIWNKAWFRKLTPKMKACFFYLFTRCDHAGIFECDLELASFMIGQKVTKEEISKAFGDRIEVLSDDKWFMPDFIPFQYTKLNPNVKAHASVIKRLEQYSEADITVAKGLGKCLCTVLSTVLDKDTDKSKDKIKDKSKEKTSYADNVTMLCREYEKLNAELSKAEVDWCIEKLSTYKAANGKTYKCDYSAIRQWVIRALRDEQSKGGLAPAEKQEQGGYGLYD